MYVSTEMHMGGGYLPVGWLVFWYVESHGKVSECVVSVCGVEKKATGPPPLFLSKVLQFRLLQFRVSLSGSNAGLGYHNESAQCYATFLCAEET